MLRLYDYPKYYDIAFSFRNIKKEVDVFEACFKRFSNIKVRSILELGSGNCPHMEELHRRGYQYNGLDINKKMLVYGRKKAKQINAQASFYHKDMVRFKINRKFDFVYVMLGSLSVKNTKGLISHFKSVANVLKKDGLYVLDWCIQFPPLGEKDNWVLEKEGIRVKIDFSLRPITAVSQLFEETITLDVLDHGKRLCIIGKDIKKFIYPQEFLLFIKNIKQFEFIGWWNNWDLKQPLERSVKTNRPIILLRRK